MVNQKRLTIEWFALLLGGALLIALLAREQVTRRFDLALLDFGTALAVDDPSPDIAIVAIDQRSLATLGEWPWSRATHAALVERLADAGARQILYDVLFVEESDAADDARLAAAIARHGNVTLPFGVAPALNMAQGIEPELPLPALADAAASLGHVEAQPDLDGTVRRFEPGLQAGGKTYPHFVAAALGMTGEAAPGDDGRADTEWPVVPFHAAGSYPQIPAEAVINGTVPRQFLEGRTVFVGATAPGMGDTLAVPTGTVELMPGVETQANLFDALRSGRMIRELPAGWTIATAIAALLLQFIGFWKLSARAGLILSLGLLAGLAVLGIALVPLARVWLAPGPGLLVLAFAYPLWSWRRLSFVSNYLEREADTLLATTGGAGRATGFDIVARQVDRMRMLVGEVNDSLAFLRSVIEASPDAILVLDGGDRVTLMNEAADRLFAATRDPVGKSLDELYNAQAIRLDAEGGQIGTPDGQVFLLASARLDGILPDGHGNRILALRDITEIRRKQREHDELIEFLSHDMRSPQVAIIALVDVLGADNPELAARIRSQAMLTLGLADGFVQLSRVGEAGAKFADTDLSTILHEAADNSFAPARKKGITIVRELGEDPVFAQVDQGQISRMAANLLSNAIKYTPEGGTVTLRLEGPAASGFARIIVSDTGPGLPKSRQRDPFMRFGARSTSEGPSVGLGLAFVKSVVDAHKGRIEVSSEPGKGTTFDIWLPLDQQ